MDEKEKNVKTGNSGEENPKKSNVGIYVLIAMVALGIYIIYSFVNFSPGFEYRGLTGNVVKEGNILFYKISVPILYQGKQSEHFFYLRNDPRELDKIPFEGEIEFNENVIIKSPHEYELACQGYGAIGVMHLNDFYNLLGAEVGKDNSAECSPGGEFSLVSLEKGNETRIDQIGPSCYRILVSDCNTLMASEKFLVENILKAREILYDGS